MQAKQSDEMSSNDAMLHSIASSVQVVQEEDGDHTSHAESADDLNNGDHSQFVGSYMPDFSSNNMCIDLTSFKSRCLNENPSQEI